jgi:hypothetical protein
MPACTNLTSVMVVLANAVKLQPLAFVSIQVLGFAGHDFGSCTCHALSAAVASSRHV